VEDIYPEGGRVVLDRDRLSDRLESVCELEKELCGFQEVLHTGSMGRAVVAPVGGEFRRYAICKEGMQHGNEFWAREMNEQEGA
jgi:hypothetical protein